MANITVEGNLVQAVSPEGQTAKVSIQDLFQKTARSRIDSCGLVLPTGTKLLYSEGMHTILVHETPPRVYGFKWIAGGSPSHFGPGAAYRTVQIGLPYLVVLTVFENGIVSDHNECFFRVAPLESEDDELLYPALLNCSRFQPPDGRPLSWICTQKLDRGPVLREKDPNKRLRAGFRILMHCLLEAGFNYSSEHHEGSSWFTESARVDPRIRTVEKWQEATAKEALFTLDVPWLKTGMSVKEVVKRTFKNCEAGSHRVTSVHDLARIIFNLQSS